jgi:hypothetical protein
MQDPENQLIPLRKFAGAMGWEIKKESGVEGRMK